MRLLENDLDQLLLSALPERRASLQQEMARFVDLFGRFLQEGNLFSLDSISVILIIFIFAEGPSIDWDKIQKLPENAVMDYSKLKSPNNDKVRKIFFFLNTI